PRPESPLLKIPIAEMQSVFATEWDCPLKRCNPSRHSIRLDGNMCVQWPTTTGPSSNYNGPWVGQSSNYRSIARLERRTELKEPGVPARRQARPVAHRIV